MRGDIGSSITPWMHLVQIWVGLALPYGSYLNKGGENIMCNPKMGLRIAWIIPNVFMYLFFFGLSVFVLIKAEELEDINQLGIWVIFLMLLLFVAQFGSYRIWSWIKQGKI